MATFVLVHGAFLGGWCWRRVIPHLRDAGHEVWTPTLTGAGERRHLLDRSVGLGTHIQDVVGVLEYEDLRGVVLVGHSYSGMVITGAADRARARVARLVYFDAQIPANGQAANGSYAEGTSERLDAMSQASDESWLLPALPLEAVGITRAEDVAWIGERRCPLPMRVLTEPIRLEHGEPSDLPRTYVWCARREGLVAAFGADPLAPFVEKAKREGFRMLTVDAGHDAMISSPREVAEALLASAE
jgi:pimeloyl-ACP methyl ester carboxylesterase